MIFSDLTRDIGNIYLEKDGNEHQDWAREGCGLMLDCACVLYFCISAGDIVAVLLSSYFILLSVADACSCIFFVLFFLW